MRTLTPSTSVLKDSRPSTTCWWRVLIGSRNGSTASRGASIVSSRGWTRSNSGWRNRISRPNWPHSRRGSTASRVKSGFWKSDSARSLNAISFSARAEGRALQSGARLAARMMPRLPDHRVAGSLAQRTRFGIKFGLETMRALVEEMGHPERAFPSLLIAGTNGKGSVAAYCDSVLRASGLRAGRYTSPHLVRVNERIAVNGHDITDAAFARAVHAVRDAATHLIRQGRLAAHPTFFEVLTAAAFEHFRSARVDVAVLEVGLGGRLDATNVVEPVASAIVSIDFDHEVYLGHTLAAIAGEKAGVMRTNRATVLG